MRWNLKNKLGYFFVFIMLSAGVGMGVPYSIPVTTQEALTRNPAALKLLRQNSGEDDKFKRQPTAGQPDHDVVQQRAKSRALHVPVASGIGIFGVFLAILFYFGRKVLQPLRQINARLQGVAEQVYKESILFSVSSLSLADGAGRQADEVEEAAASIEQLLEQAQTNNESARQAAALSKGMQELVRESGARMLKMRQVMQETAGQSAEVMKIIKNINDIAFQTSLLAHNAAVETAGAGESGAGFGVVAGEIRRLSCNVASSAKETADIILNIIVKLERNSVLCENLDKAFVEIYQGIARVDEEVRDIAVASAEQVIGIRQVRAAMGEIDTVSQAASAEAEEAAMTATELVEQAVELRGISGALAALINGQEEVGKEEGQWREESNGLLPRLGYLGA